MGLAKRSQEIEPEDVECLPGTDGAVLWIAPRGWAQCSVCDRLGPVVALEGHLGAEPEEADADAARLCVECGEAPVCAECSVAACADCCGAVCPECRAFAERCSGCLAPLCRGEDCGSRCVDCQELVCGDCAISVYLGRETQRRCLDCAVASVRVEKRPTELDVIRRDYCKLMAARVARLAARPAFAHNDEEELFAAVSLAGLAKLEAPVAPSCRRVLRRRETMPTTPSPKRMTGTKRPRGAAPPRLDSLDSMPPAPRTPTRRPTARSTELIDMTPPPVVRRDASAGAVALVGVEKGKKNELA